MPVFGSHREMAGRSDGCGREPRALGGYRWRRGPDAAHVLIVTDAGLASLKGLRQLQTLVLKGTRVTDAGVADLQKALPQLKIIR